MRLRGVWALGVAGLVTAATATAIAIAGRPEAVVADGPHYGGTLTMVGTGDVDYMDPNLSYYTVGYLADRMWTRQLFSYPALRGKTTQVQPDLATDMPTQANGEISADGRTVTVHIVQGAMWNTSPPRQVTADDAIRGVLRTCNPALSTGALADYEDQIAGLATFCDEFSRVTPTVPAMRRFVESHLHSVPGLQVGADERTVVFTLTRATSSWISELALTAFTPAPKEFLDYLPGSLPLARAGLSDGPYVIQSYIPNQSIVFVRNPAWSRSTDRIRRAYVDKVVVNEDTPPDAAFQQVRHGDADLGWTTPVPSTRSLALIQQRDPNLLLLPELATNPYLLFNMVSPSNHGAMRDPRFRRALTYAIDRRQLIGVLGGPHLNPPLTHVLPSGFVGSHPFDPYPFNPARARRLLGTAGYSRGVTLRFLYLPSHPDHVQLLHVVQRDLARVGITVTGVAATQETYYNNYATWPPAAHRGLWDLQLQGWGPDWYDDAALSFFKPMFGGRPAFPPNGSDFGLYDSPALDALIHRASGAARSAVADRLWSQADHVVMRDAPFFPIASPTQPLVFAPRVQNAVAVPALQGIDPTNVWVVGGGP